MLRHTIERVKRMVPIQRMRIVVNSQHMKYVDAEIPKPERKSLVSLPAIAKLQWVFFPAIQILAEDPSACITVFPSDHFVLEEQRVMSFVNLPWILSIAALRQSYCLGFLQKMLIRLWMD